MAQNVISQDKIGKLKQKKYKKRSISELCNLLEKFCLFRHLANPPAAPGGAEDAQDGGGVEDLNISQANPPAAGVDIPDGAGVLNQAGPSVDVGGSTAEYEDDDVFSVSVVPRNKATST